MNRSLIFAIVVAGAGCLQPEATGLARTEGSGAKVTFDIYAKPLPEIPLPNDFATRFDATTPTKRRINASTEASTIWERATRTELDNLDGWGTYQSIAVGFDRPLDVQNIIDRHQGDDYDPADDAVFLIDVTPDSPEFCQRTPLDMGEGNFPVVLESPKYFDNDRDGDNLLFEDREEDLNGNGQLDPGEDLDMDGVLDHPNVLHPGDSTFNVLSFYERETNTLLMKPVMPLREKTTYAVVLTKRLVDADGKPVTSPFPYVNHASQTPALKPLEQCLPNFGLGLDDIGFTWSYTTQNVSADYVAIRDGMYGLGPMQRLATEYPAVIKKILPMKDDDKNGTVNVRIVRTDEFFTVAMQLLQQLEGGSTLTPSYQAIADSHQFVDFHAVFQFDSPQFFPRNDSEGNLLPLYKQLIQVDPVTGAAFTRPETITVWVVIPKIRPADGSPPPAVILGHGYGSNKMEALFYAGFLARFGIATIALENVSHGIDFDPITMDLAEGLFASKGLGNMFNSVARNGRAFDQNQDGIDDSGADFWTAYILHTREVVKQSALDYMQLVKLLRGFDGQQRTNYDSNHDGQRDLAGDFDGDGKIDLGGPNGKLSMMGGSLGGIMSGMMAGLEPALQQAVPISGGAGLPDIGIRSIQGGVREAVNLRMLGPLFVTIPNNNGVLEAWQELPDLAGLGKVKLGTIDATPVEGDTAVLFNVTSGEQRCARVEANGRLRVAVSSDQGDKWRLALYTGALPPKPRDGCEVPEGTDPYFTFDKFQLDVTFQGKVAADGSMAVTHTAGSPLVALGDGFGLRRQSPELRRFMGLAQLAIERGDPVNFVQNAVGKRELVYGTGEKVDTHFLVVNTIGDMNVPVATGVSLARVAGIIDLENKDARYGKTQNRVLIDTGTIEAVERVGRTPNSLGAPVLMDVDRLSLFTDSTMDKDGFDVQRLNTPLRIRGPARNGGVTGMLLPMVVPTGRHGFDTPDPSLPSNLGAVMLNSLARFMTTEGAQLPDIDPCLETSTCSWIAQTPP